MATNPVAKNLSYVNKEAVRPERPELQRCVPFRVAASVCASGLVAHEPALSTRKHQQLTLRARGARHVYQGFIQTTQSNIQ